MSQAIIYLQIKITRLLFKIGRNTDATVRHLTKHLVSTVILVTVIFNTQALQASMDYLNDTNNMSPKVIDTSIRATSLDYPKIMLSENVVLYGDMEKYSKYDIIQTQAYQSQMQKITDLQDMNPGVRYFRQFNLEYLEYNSSLYCSQGNGIPFERTEDSTEGCSVFAGHWLYEPGALLAEYLSSNATSVSVTNMPNIKVGDYAVIYDAPAGSFNNPEHVKVLSVNKENRKITLSRGYKSTASSHKNGSIIAMHVRGQAGSSFNWMYNLSSISPKDKNGNRYIDYVAKWLVDNFNRDHRGVKQLIRVDGIAFDIDFRYSISSKNADTNNDLTVDFGIHPETGNSWSDGIDTLYSLVRKKFPGLYVSGGIVSSPGYETNNGTQLEGWPTAKDFSNVNPDYHSIDARLSDYMLRHREHVAPQHFHALSKTPTLLYPNGTSANSNKPFRFAFGTALLGDGFYGQQNNKKHSDPWYDEYAVDVMLGSPKYGTAAASNSSDESLVRTHKGWLGQPLGNRIRVFDPVGYQEVNDLLSNKGTFDASIDGWSGKNVSIQLDTTSRKDGKGSLRTSTHAKFDPGLYNTFIKGPNVSLIQNSWYTVTFSAKADDVRNIKVSIGGAGQSFMINNEWRRYVMAFKAPKTGLNSIKVYVGREDTQVWLDTVRIFEGNVNIFRRNFDNGIVVVNATDKVKIVDLGGVFLRIQGTQDPVNDGSSVELVTLEPYDAAILVRPDAQTKGPAPVSPAPTPDAPSGGNECGAPDYFAGDDEAIYLWKDCQGDGSWHFRVTGGGSATAIAYTGTITSSKTFTGIKPYSLESSDVLDISDSSNLDFKFKAMKAGDDGVDFSFPDDSTVCFNSISHSNILLGSETTPTLLPLNLETLVSCESSTDYPEEECGTPIYDASTEQGAFLWKDCGTTDTWHLRVTAGGSRKAKKFLGTLTSPDPLSLSTYSVESSDDVDISNVRKASFKLVVIGKGEDGLDFDISNSGACFNATELSDSSVYLGSLKLPVSTPLDLASMGSCQ